jgi:hypothetical protein
MEPRDRRASLTLIGAAAVAWIAVGAVLVSFDPRTSAVVRYAGAALIGTALALTLMPLFWLAAFARQGRIAFLGDWLRAARRGAWVGGVVGVTAALRLEGMFQLPVSLFLAVLATIAEVTLSARR